MTLATQAPVVLSQPAASTLADDATRPNESISILIASLSATYGLDDRERAIARLVFLGFELPAIAERLELSARRVGWALQDLFAKTGTDSAKSLIRLALRHASERERLDAPVRAMPRWTNVNDQSS